MDLSQDQIVIILGILLGISELLAVNPKFKSNSILQFVIGALKKVISKKEEEPKKDVEQIAEELAIEEVIKVVEEEINKLKK